MSPAIMFCAASRGFHSSHSVLLSANSSFCLIGVLIGVGARDFLCSTVALAGYLSFQENLERRTKHRALSRAPTAVTRAALGSCNECGARRALAYSAN